jgi:hypothetical protein
LSWPGKWARIVKAVASGTLGKTFEVLGDILAEKKDNGVAGQRPRRRKDLPPSSGPAGISRQENPDVELFRGGTVNLERCDVNFFPMTAVHDPYRRIPMA